MLLVKVAACDLLKRDVSSVTSGPNMFFDKVDVHDLPKWNASRMLSGVTQSLSNLFDCDLSKWDVSSMSSRRGMFFDKMTACDLARGDE